MKTKTKALVLALCAVLLVVTTVFATMAFLTDTDSVENTFTVGNVDITLEETDFDGDGDKKQNHYHLLPGQSYTKDPTVTVVKNSEEAYVRMLVTVSNIEALKDAFPTYVVNDVFLLQNLVEGWDDDVWLYEGYDPTTATYEFRYYEVVKKSNADQKLDALFTDVVIDGSVTDEALAYLKDGITIDVVAHAIQATGFDGDADAAWAAFDAAN